MTGNEHKPQEIITHVFITVCLMFRCSQLLLNLDITTDLFILAFEPHISADLINGMMFRGCHEPGTWFIRNTGLWPLLQCRDERTLGKIFRQTYISHHACESRDQPGGFDPPDCIDRALKIRIHTNDRCPGGPSSGPNT